MVLKSRVTILVKASPQPSKKHNETVCCAGLQEDGTWKRLFPIRFRHLSDDKTFKRWNLVDFDYRKPSDDSRAESCRVHEESLKVSGFVSKPTEKSSLVERALMASENEALAKGHSLTLIRPQNVSFTWKKLSLAEIESDRQKYQSQAAQLSLLDEEIAAYEPCPYKFTMHYDDEGGPHRKSCADWETSATFFNLRQSMDEEKVLRHLQSTYCEKYVKTGLVFALGNVKKRPHTWQLLGIFPAAPAPSRDLFSF